MTNDEYTNQQFMLDVGDGHQVNVYDWGNPNAETVIFHQHGGPGSRSKDRQKQVFDPTTQRVIFHDQRGCGNSIPYGSLEHNTTYDLVEDISKIADRLSIDTFVLMGTSWGSTLSLAYAVAHPDRVKALIIGGVFTGSQSEVDWLDKGMMQSHYPDVWRRYLDRTPEEHHDNASAYHFNRVLNGTVEEQKQSAYAYENLEGGVMLFDDTIQLADYEKYDPTSICVEIHYLANGCFMPDRHIMDNVGKLAMPVAIIQGRYDMVCPPRTAYELSQKLPNASLYWTLSNHAVEHEGKNIFRLILKGMER